MTTEQSLESIDTARNAVSEDGYPIGTLDTQYGKYSYLLCEKKAHIRNEKDPIIINGVAYKIRFELTYGKHFSNGVICGPEDENVQGTVTDWFFYYSAHLSICKEGSYGHSCTTAAYKRIREGLIPFLCKFFNSQPELLVTARMAFLLNSIKAVTEDSEKIRSNLEKRTNDIVYLQLLQGKFMNGHPVDFEEVEKIRAAKHR